MKDLWADEPTTRKEKQNVDKKGSDLHFTDRTNMTGAAKITKKPGNMGTLEGFGDMTPFLPRAKWTARKRPSHASAKNHKAAVALPHGGQSYNPEDTAHQSALAQAAQTLARKKAQHEKFMAEQLRRESDLIKARDGAAKKADESEDEGSDDEADEAMVPLGDKPSRRTEETKSSQLRKLQQQKEKRIARGKKKLTKTEQAQLARKNRGFKRQPKADPDLDRVEDVADEVAARLYRSHRMSVHRKKLRRLDQTTVAFGRHHHQPVALEVAPTAALTGSLRTMLNNQTAAHCVQNPLVDRVKSLEARNMIPARMRHTYNKKKEVLQPGEVKVHRESFGTLPDDRFRN